MIAWRVEGLGRRPRPRLIGMLDKEGCIFGWEGVVGVEGGGIGFGGRGGVVMVNWQGLWMGGWLDGRMGGWMGG